MLTPLQYPQIQNPGKYTVLGGVYWHRFCHNGRQADRTLLGFQGRLKVIHIPRKQDEFYKKKYNIPW